MSNDKSDPVAAQPQPSGNAGELPAGVAAALARMDALLDPATGLLTVPQTSATVQASRTDMATIRAALAAQASGPVVGWEIPHAVLGSELTAHEARADEARRQGLEVHPLVWQGAVTQASGQAHSTGYPHITQPYTLAEIEARIASNDYGAEHLLQHAMLLLRASGQAQDAEDAARWREIAQRFDSCKTSEAERVLEGLGIDPDRAPKPLADIIDAARQESKGGEGK